MSESAETVTVAICSYNGAVYLPKLIGAVAALSCPVPFDILLIDNNSTDGTAELIKSLVDRMPIPLRYVREPKQGIAFARNRAIEESLNSTYLAFLDTDELPDPGWLVAACLGLRENGADCVGGRIRLILPNRPAWLTDGLRPFLGQVDYGPIPIEVVDRTTPIWSGNIAYRTRLFADGLRFDTRYNRAGDGIGGGEDAAMFRALLAAERSIRYEPDMSIVHLIPDWKLKRRYFLRLHFLSGKKAGLNELRNNGSRTFLSVPGYMYLQLLRRLFVAASEFLRRNPGYLREGMNLAHQLGMMYGCRLRAK